MSNHISIDDRDADKKIIGDDVTDELCERKKTLRKMRGSAILDPFSVHIGVLVDGKPPDVHKIVTDYNKWLQETELPKLLFYANPGGLTNEVVVNWSKANLKNLENIDLGQGIHYLQEDHPKAIGKTLASWIGQQKSKFQ